MGDAEIEVNMKYFLSFLVLAVIALLSFLAYAALIDPKEEPAERPANPALELKVGDFEVSVSK